MNKNKRNSSAFYLVVLLLLSAVLVACGPGGNNGGGEGDNNGGGGGSNPPIDSDNDGVADNVDVDDDGDGLIEILNAASLNSVRYNLAGAGLDLTNTDNDNEAGGSSMGCGNGTRAGVDITTCNGYELMQDIDLNDLIGMTAPDGRSYRVENNWERIGSCAIGPLSGEIGLSAKLCDTSSSGTEQFSGIFEGNGMTISNMQMHIDGNTMNIGLAAGNSVTRSSFTQISSFVNNTYSGVGFFGAVSSASVIRNLHMENITISGDGIRLYATGSLVGYGADANIINSAVELVNITGNEYIGGLIGLGDGAIINRLSAIVDTIEATGDNIGGLVGSASSSARISSSLAIVDTIKSDASTIGGLVGIGDTSTISSSLAIVDTIEGDNTIGGWAGLVSSSATISSSLAIVDTIKGNNNLGGFVGFGIGARISNSLVISNEIDGSDNVHQFSGGSANPSILSDSYWQEGVMATNADFLTNVRGTNQTASALQSPTSFTGIYMGWANAWCDPATGVFITDSSNALAIDANRAWDLGNGSEYPVISSACFGDRLTPQLQRTLIQRITNDQPLLPLP